MKLPARLSHCGPGQSGWRQTANILLTTGRPDWLLPRQRLVASSIQPVPSGLVVHIHGPRACRKRRSSTLELDQRNTSSEHSRLEFPKTAFRHLLPCRLTRAAGALSSTFDSNVIPGGRTNGIISVQRSDVSKQQVDHQLTFDPDLIFGRREIVSESSYDLQKTDLTTAYR